MMTIQEMESSLTVCVSMFSIREFCHGKTPIIMFDVKGDFVVLRLEQVRDSIQMFFSSSLFLFTSK
jgi:hypothetical protein